MGNTYYVSKNGNDKNSGDKNNPFLTIQQASQAAMPGDTVCVHGGVYREWVKPVRGGTSNKMRITYTAAKNERPVIKGSEIVDTWKKHEGTVWAACLDNTIFGDFNPFAEILKGDWLEHPLKDPIHLGDVYMDGKSFYEASSLEEVLAPIVRTHGVSPPWINRQEEILHPEDTIYTYFAAVTGDTTTIYANFNGVNPNEVCTEINVRKCCFYPDKTGCDYITVKGFEFAQAASPWAPPTSEQFAMLGANWSRGWVIEDNLFHDAKCSAVSIGKADLNRENMCSRFHKKPGYQYQFEQVFRALQVGWSKDTVGSHIIRNNKMYDCGQNGIVGHMGCIFSEIYGNEIYNIGVKHEYFGYEIAGIKLHAAIDVIIEKNNIHNTTLGTWLDWQTQGTRVTKNLYYNNDRDLMVEVSHGPYIVDGNIFASDYNLDNVAQGGAYVHNLFCGSLRRDSVPDRSTPYHFAHTTQVSGSAITYGGDDRFYQNMFIGGKRVYIEASYFGTADYDGSPISEEEYIERITAHTNGDQELYANEKQTVYINGNSYYAGATAFDRECDKLLSDFNPAVSITTADGHTYVEFDMDGELKPEHTRILSTDDLAPVRIVECDFESFDGSAIVFDCDYNYSEYESAPMTGPFAEVKQGHNKICVW